MNRRKIIKTIFSYIGDLLYKIVDDFCVLLNRFVFCIMFLVAAAGIIMMLGILIIPAIQCIDWLMDGTWNPLPIVLVVPEHILQEVADQSSWVGLKKIIGSIFNIPLCWLIFGCGCLVTYFGSAISGACQMIIDDRQYCPHCRRYYLKSKTKSCPRCGYLPVKKTENEIEQESQAH